MWPNIIIRPSLTLILQKKLFATNALAYFGKHRGRRKIMFCNIGTRIKELEPVQLPMTWGQVSYCLGYTGTRTTKQFKKSMLWCNKLVSLTLCYSFETSYGPHLHSSLISMMDLCFACSWITSILDPTVWLDGASPANTCITPSFPWMAPAQLPGAPTNWNSILILVEATLQVAPNSDSGVWESANISAHRTAKENLLLDLKSPWNSVYNEALSLS